MAELYRLDFPNGKSYVGITRKGTFARFSEHLSEARNRPEFAVHHAINKHGLPDVKTLAVGTWDYLKEAEKKAIKVFNTKAPKGYNLTDGGEGVTGNTMSVEARALLSVFNTGKVMTQEAKDKIAIAVTNRMAQPGVREQIAKKLSGKTVSEETKAKLSAAARRRYENAEERKKASDRMLGRKVSAETCEKLSRSLNAYYDKVKQHA